MKKIKKDNKPIIETIINTVALAITATGINFIITKDWYGFPIIIFAGAIEFFKYWGRKKELW